MTFRFRPLRLALLVLAALGLGQPARAADLTFVSLGTGTTGGVYYPLGAAICDFANRQYYRTGVRCSVEATVGSVYNVEALGTGELDLAILQADIERDAHSGVGRWTGRPLLQLRSLFGLYPEVMTIVARKDAGIAAVADLAGKRVDIGSRGSGARATWEMLEQGLGWQRETFGKVFELRPAVADQELCSGHLDASLQMVGHPSARIVETLRACDLTLVPVTGPAVDALIAAKPHLTATVVHGGPYGLAADVASFGGVAILSATAETPDPVVAAVALAVIDHLDELKSRFPVLEGADIKAMVAAAQKAAPLHPGVELALRERGLAP